MLIINQIIISIIIILSYIFIRYLYSQPKNPEQLKVLYGGTRLCNSRGCDVRFVQECEKGMCLKSWKKIYRFRKKGSI